MCCSPKSQTQLSDWTTFSIKILLSKNQRNACSNEVLTTSITPPHLPQECRVHVGSSGYMMKKVDTPNVSLGTEKQIPLWAGLSGGPRRGTRRWLGKGGVFLAEPPVSEGSWERMSVIAGPMQSRELSPPFPFLHLCTSEPLPVPRPVSPDIPATLLSSLLGKWQTFTTHLARHQDKARVCSLDGMQ